MLVISFFFESQFYQSVNYKTQLILDLFHNKYFLFFSATHYIFIEFTQKMKRNETHRKKKKIQTIKKPARIWVMKDSMATQKKTLFCNARTTYFQSHLYNVKGV